MTRSLLIVAILALFGGLAGAPAALAQDAAPASSTITTTGSGEASAPAESAQLQFLVSDENAFYGGPPTAPQVEATPGAAAQAAVQPVVDAIAAIGMVESVAVVVPLISDPYRSPSPLARIDVAVIAPDLVGLTRLIGDAVQAAAGERLLVSYVGARFGTSNCQALETEARTAALADARSRAGIQAGLLDVELGEVVATRDIANLALESGAYGTFIGSSSGCDPATPGNAAILGNVVSLPPFDPTINAGEVDIYRTVEVTFAMIGGEVTPAS